MKSGPISTEAVDRLARGLAQVPGLVAAYLFGSHGRGNAAASSDVDVAVLLNGVPDLDSVGGVLAVCQDTLEREDVDLVVLNTATPILAFEAISGRRILTVSPSETAGFESLVSREYEDELARLTRASSYPAR